MDIAASAISLNVADPDASATFLSDHFGFSTDMSGAGYQSLSRPDAGFNLIYLRAGLSTFKPEAQKGPAGGLLIVFVVGDIDAEHRRLVERGVVITTPLQTEPWGERFLQVTDPNGIVIQLVQWVTQPDEVLPPEMPDGGTQ
jgi:predicted enzyme related to lactoylglutathione lyase